MTPFVPPRWLAWRPRLPALDARTVLPTLTVVLLLLNTPEIWYFQIPLVLVSVVGLSFSSWLRTTPYWFVMATLLGATVCFHWDVADNHQYLFVYWCLALCAAFSLPEQEQEAALALSARWLLGLCMLLATVWKLATPEYVDGTFFEFTLLADARFADFARLAGGLPADALADNRELVSLVKEGHARGLKVNGVALASAPGIESLAIWLTWWTVAIEGGLAVLFLWPDRGRLAPWRHTALLLFAVTTYSVAHVRGFGWMLMLLGMAQCRREEQGWRMAYLAVLLLIQLYLFPLIAIGERLAGLLRG